MRPELIQVHRWGYAFAQNPLSEDSSLLKPSPHYISVVIGVAEIG